MKKMISILILMAAACTEKESSGPHPEEGEGANEFDPGPPIDEGGVDGGEPEETPDGETPESDPPEDTGSPEDEDTGEVPPSDTGSAPEDVGVEVCYPGALEDYSACFPVVAATDSMGAGYAYPEPYEGNPQYNPPTGYLDLRVSDHDHPVSPNFVFSEFMSEAKGPFGFFQVHVVESLQAIREASGGPIYVNSGYRNVTYNESVGGATWSRHIYGDAVDMYSGVLSLAELEDVCKDMGADFTLLYDTHVHCDWRDHPLDLSFFD